MARRGFTLLELLVTLAVIAVLVSLLVPAVQQVRESARRLQCQSHLKQLGIALHSYHDVYGMFPMAGIGDGRSFHVSILPFIEQPALAELAVQAVTWQDLESLGRRRVPLFKCPSDPAAHRPQGDRFEPLNYVVNVGTGFQEHGYNGFFVVPRHGKVRAADVVDGLSNTAAISESLVGDGSPHIRRRIWVTPYPLVAAGELEQFAALCRQTAITGTANSAPSVRWVWTDGGDPMQTRYNHVLYPNDVSCVNEQAVQEGAYSTGSLHPGGVHGLLGDGHVRFFATHVDLQVWRAVGSRHGGEADVGINP
jgi:prepilin-type N-terminal cleavage/methylation domain-containing protein